MTILGANSVLLVGPHGGQQISVTGIAQGTENIAASNRADIRQVPGGRGAISSQGTPYDIHDFGFATDFNHINGPLFRRANGQRLDFTWRPEGTGSGLPEFKGEAVATVSVVFGVASNAVVFTVGMAVDGKPSEAPQA